MTSKTFNDHWPACCQHSTPYRRRLEPSGWPNNICVTRCAHNGNLVLEEIHEGGLTYKDKERPLYVDYYQWEPFIMEGHYVDPQHAGEHAAEKAWVDCFTRLWIGDPPRPEGGE